MDLPQSAASPAPTAAPAAAGRWAALRSLAPFCLLLLGFHVCFGGFFPNQSGGLGHDYSFMLPALLAGKYWFVANGPGAVPWFTPAFCGGQPLFADPQSFYYSLPQGLALVLDPLRAVYVSVLLFAGLGYWGSYRLSRDAFATSRAAAEVGATLFMFNGFFAYRMVIGHFTFHAFMLLPLLGALLLAPSRNPRWRNEILRGWGLGLGGAYFVYSGMLNLVLPGAAALLALVCLRALVAPAAPWSRICLRALLGGLVMAGLAAAKIVASLSYLHAFPRVDYLLPGMKTVGDVLFMVFRTVFMPSPNMHLEALPALANIQFSLGRHEFEFGMGLVALALLAWGAMTVVPAYFSETGRAARARSGFSSRKWMTGLALLALLVLPIALNTYSPEWNLLLKQIPIIKASSNLFRWFAMFIPLVAVLCGLVFNRVPRAYQGRLALLTGLLVVGINLGTDKQLYAVEGYRPEAVVAASDALASSGSVPAVGMVIGQLLDPATGALRGVSQFPNDQLAGGNSALACYNPIFGYGLEHFPVKTLHEGAPTEATDGHLNFKNPACYTYPEANQCEPGDHFREDEMSSLKALLAYHVFPFEFSSAQKWANGITLASLGLSLLLLLGVAYRRVVPR